MTIDDRHGLFLRDGRRVQIDSILIRRTGAGFLAGTPEAIWDYEMGERGLPPAYLVEPVNPRFPGHKWLPEWRVRVELRSPPDPFQRFAHGDNSCVTLVFFCPDLSTLMDLIASQVAEMDEDTWVRYAYEWMI